MNDILRFPISENIFRDTLRKYGFTTVKIHEPDSVATLVVGLLDARLKMMLFSSTHEEVTEEFFLDSLNDMEIDQTSSINETNLVCCSKKEKNIIHICTILKNTAIIAACTKDTQELVFQILDEIGYIPQPIIKKYTTKKK